ncbi:MAG: endolytic transglycosylase MltG [Oscillospiraceae bacterium]
MNNTNHYSNQSLKRNPNRWLTALIGVIICVGFGIFLAFFILGSATDMLGLNQQDRQIELTVPKDLSHNEIIKLLSNEGIIEQPLTFQLFTMLKSLRKKEVSFQNGIYIFNSNMGYDEIYRALTTGDTIKEEVRITFYEGMTLSDIGKLLEEKKVCTKKDFLKAVDSINVDFEVVKAIPDDKNRFRKLEGYIFPDTYDFFVGENINSVIKKFINNFNNRITDEMKKRAEELDMTLDQVIILASIIQKECSNPDEMGKVSSVFHNRLKNQVNYPKLQSDVTVFYVNDDIKPYLSSTNQPMYDAYNTYQCIGLPVGPVSNPGLQTIKATLYPDDTNYVYFLTDNTGKFYYAENLKQHNNNLAQAKKVNDSIKNK